MSSLSLTIASLSSSSSLSSPSALFVIRRRFAFFSSQSIKINYTRTTTRPPPPTLRVSSLAESERELSWLSPDQYPLDNYGGWSVFEAQNNKKKNGLPRIVIWGIGSSLAALLGAIAYFSLSRKGLKFQFGSSLNALHGMLNWGESKSNGSRTSESNVADRMLTEETPDSTSNARSETVVSRSLDKHGRVIVSVAVDSTQQEALSILKKLKIIEDEVRADELCTRQEYARWLVRINSLLERNPKHRIVPSILLSGSIIAAFDDVAVDDPDFKYIQAVAEAGIIPSKLSGNNSTLDGLKDQGNVYFFPESFISRQDLVNWKAQVEYEVKPGVIEQISTTAVDYMDVKGINSDASPELFMDMLAGDKSILRKVFGQVKRFQPNKPSTKAQAAVALTSGRMAQAVYSELARLKAEKISRQAVMEEIRCELLEKGDIQRLWDEKLDEEKARGLKVEELYLEAVSDLEQEKVVQERSFVDSLKEKAAMDCQRQLLLSLKEEVDEISEKLASERAMFVVEQRGTQEILSDLESKQEEMLDKKSVLEAEKESLRILRSWVEDDARKSQARAKVLEEVGRRWRWDNPS